MRRRFLIIFSAFCLGVLIYSWVLDHKHSAALAQSKAVAAAPESLPEEVNPIQLAEESRRAQEHLKNLADLEVKLRLRREADAKMYEARSLLQRERYAAWSSVINTNSQAFEALRQQADTSPAQKAPCTICDGTGAMHYCVLCENDGKCASCKGTGKGWGEACPTCKGNGKCFLCVGSGRMACLFCDDGTISRTVALPPRMLPVKCDPVPSFDTHASDSELAAHESERTSEGKNAAETSRMVAPSPEGDNPNALVNTFVLPLAAAALVVAALGILLTRRADSISARITAATAARLEALIGEIPSLEAFFAELRAGLNGSPLCQVPEAIDSNGLEPRTNEIDPAALESIRSFLAVAPGKVAGLRTRLTEIGRAADPDALQKVMLEFHREVAELKELAWPRGLSPFSLVAYALAGLLKETCNDTSNVTPSVQQTMAGAVDLLKALCARGVNPNLATEPPIRLLAVDDDAVSRLAISFALKKAFNKPDLAPDGPAALELIGQQRYDVIFLDVDMPGMDGFELCTRIRQAGLNQTTPVVFVTRHSDFNSRAKSTQSGGQGLIGKPFLTFEITVKALTLALRGRLRNDNVDSRAASEEALKLHPAVELETAAVPAAQPVSAVAPSGDPGAMTPALVKATGDNSSEAFFLRAPGCLEQLRNDLHAVQNAAGPHDLKTSLDKLFLGVHSLNLGAEAAGLHPVRKLSSVLEGMLKKLVENTEYCSPSALGAAAGALELLDDLCRARFDSDLGYRPIRLLVVDDDVVTLRAISGALQLVFGRPDKADSGEAAVALATEKPFDLIFLDVLMPGMSGFAACKKIHETELNRRTPVVFVTGHDDTESRSQATAAGGCGFIPKPVLASQITLTALVYIMRARFNQAAPTLPSPVQSGLEATPSPESPELCAERA